MNQLAENPDGKLRQKIIDEIWKMGTDELQSLSQYLWIEWDEITQNLPQAVTQETATKIKKKLDLSKFALPIDDANNVMNERWLGYWERAIAAYYLHTSILNKFLEKNQVDVASSYIDEHILPFLNELLQDWVLDSQIIESIANLFASKSLLTDIDIVFKRPELIYKHSKKYKIDDSQNINWSDYYLSGVADLIDWYIERWSISQISLSDNWWTKMLEQE